VWRLNARVKWLWSAKPAARAISEIGWSVVASRDAAQSSRNRRRYAGTDMP
jgi:hypothetical protein